MNGNDEAAIGFAKKYIEEGRDILLPAFIVSVINDSGRKADVSFCARQKALTF